MNERKLRRLFHGILLSSVPLPLTLGLVACGGVSQHDDGDETAGSTAEGGTSQGGRSSGGTGGRADGGYAGTGGTGISGSTFGGAAGAGAVAGQAGAAGGPCSGAPGSCFEPRTVYVSRDCADPTQPPSPEQCAYFCPVDFNGGVSMPATCSVLSYDETRIEISCNSTCYYVGRRPSGFQGSDCSGAGLGAQLASIALLEAASVFAFRDLRAELASHGAPRWLRRRVSRAARDEVRHARRTRGLAQRFGGKVSASSPARSPAPPRSLEAMACDNAVEGCLRETFGALVAHYQALHARDPELRGALARIARDETRHAALSWALHAWLEQRLDHGARERVRAAQRAAAQQLYGELAVQSADDPANLAGFPAPAAARQLFSQALPALWARADVSTVSLAPTAA